MNNLYCDSQNTLTIFLTGLSCYLLYILTAWLTVVFNRFGEKYLKKFNNNLTSFLVKFNVGLLTQEILIGLISWLTYIFILQFKYYLPFQFPPIITFFYFAALIYLLKNISLFINWLGYLWILYIMDNSNNFTNPDGYLTYYVLATASGVSLLIVYGLKWWLKKRYYLFGLLKSLVFLTIILVCYFGYFNQSGGEYFDWMANIFASYGISIFLESIGSYFLSKYQGLSYLKDEQIYSHHFFINQTQALARLHRFLNTEKVNLGVYLTFDLQIDKHGRSNQIESYINGLFKLMLKQYSKLFLIAPNFNYSVFIKLKEEGNKTENLMQFKRQINRIVYYINQVLSLSKSKGFFKVFYSDFGYQFFNLNSLIQICELGIYNLDYGDQIYCKSFQKNEFLAELATAKEKKRLKQQLEDYHCQYILEEDDHYHYLKVVSVKKLIFQFEHFWKKIDNSLWPIFLRRLGFIALKQYQKLKNPLKPIRLIYSYQHLLTNDYEFGKLINKIKSSQIAYHQICFDFSYHKSIRTIQESQNYQQLKERLLAYGFQVIDPSNWKPV